MEAHQSLVIQRQNTCESCLSVSLMALLKFQKGISTNGNDEYNILFEGLKFSKLDFSTGHLVYIAKIYPDITIEQYIDSETFCKTLSDLEIPSNLKMIHKKINFKFLKKMVNESPVIIYIDIFTILREYHYSHFVILSKIGKHNSILYDPWLGEKLQISNNELQRSISSVRNRLKISPKLIRVI